MTSGCCCLCYGGSNCVRDHRLYSTLLIACVRGVCARACSMCVCVLACAPACARACVRVRLRSCLRTPSCVCARAHKCMCMVGAADVVVTLARRVGTGPVAASVGPVRRVGVGSISIGVGLDHCVGVGPTKVGVGTGEAAKTRAISGRCRASSEKVEYGGAADGRVNCAVGGRRQWTFRPPRAPYFRPPMLNEDDAG